MTADVVEPAIRMGSGVLRIPRLRLTSPLDLATISQRIVRDKPAGSWSSKPSNEKLPRQTFEARLDTAMRAKSAESSGDLDLKRYHSQELMQQEKEGQKVLMLGGAQVISQPYATLNSGNRIPLIGLGTFKSTDEVMDEAVAAALRHGVRHIDCAEHYGNEPAIGRALTKAFKAGYAKREETFITSKLWNTDHGEHNVRPALLKSLKDLQLDYLDLYLIHWPVTEPQKPGDDIDPPLSETWAAMEKLVEEGLVKSIGVSNCSIAKIERLLKTAKVKPAVNQVEIHPFWRNDAVREFCAQEGIHVSAYCPLGTPYTSAKAVIRRAQSVSSHPKVKQLAAKYNKHVLALLLRWGIQRGNSVLAKSSNPHHIRGNLEGSLGWAISPEDMHTLSSIEFQLRLVDGIRFLRPEGPFRNMDEMWDDQETEAFRQKFIHRMYKFPENPGFRLSTGATMPVLGLGTWKDQQVSNTVQRALRRGFRHVDCSSQPDNEAEIGGALEEIFSDWIVNRPDVFITAKLQEAQPSNFEAAVAAMLARLKVSYVDLLLLPVDQLGSSQELQEAWQALEACCMRGQAKALGLASASMHQLSSVLSFCSVRPAANSVEVHPYCRNERLVQLCRAKDVHVMASSWPSTAYMLHKKDAPALLSDEAVVSLARSFSKHPSQILIRWAIQHGHSVSPKASSDLHLQGILDVLNWKLPGPGYQQLCKLQQEAPKKNLEDMEPEPGTVAVLEHLNPPQE